MTPLLAVHELSMVFGGLQALQGVSFEVAAGSITAIIGPNGAGKTTVFNCVTGFYRPTGGQVWLHGPRGRVNLPALLGEPFHRQDWQPVALGRWLYRHLFGGSHAINRAGVARTFQNIRLFREMTVVENLLVAQHQQVNTNLLAGLLATRGYRQAEAAALEQARQALLLVGLLEDANRLAGSLPYGSQRRLEIARAWCTRPCLLCLDEPAAGLNPRETRELGQLLRAIRDQHHITLLLIEHDMGLVMEVSDQVVVLDHGVVIARGTPDQVRRDARVLEAYLGIPEPEDLEA